MQTVAKAISSALGVIASVSVSKTYCAMFFNQPQVPQELLKK